VYRSGLYLWPVSCTSLCAASGKRLRLWLPAAPHYTGWVVLALVIGYTVVRNIPHPAFEPLRPTDVEVDRKLLEQQQSQTPSLP